MSRKRSSLFGSTHSLIRQIDEFLDCISMGSLVFDAGVAAYLDADDDAFLAKVKQLEELEHNGDILKRDIQTEMYTEMLIPESRGDVLHLIRNLDELLDGMKRKLERIEIMRPDFPAEYKKDLRELVAQAMKCVDSIIGAARTYFRDVRAVRDHVQKVVFYESEADGIEKRLLRAVYASELPMERKMMLRDVIEFIGMIANFAEDCGDHLQIYAIKRAL